MEQDVVRPACRRGVHDLKSHATLRHEAHDVELRPQQRFSGTENDDVGVRRQRRFQIARTEVLRSWRLPVTNDSVGGYDEMSANPVFADTYAAVPPGGDMVCIGDFPGELDDSLRWRVCGDYTRPRHASTPPRRLRAAPGR